MASRGKENHSVLGKQGTVLLRQVINGLMTPLPGARTQAYQAPKHKKEVGKIVQPYNREGHGGDGMKMRIEIPEGVVVGFFVGIKA